MPLEMKRGGIPKKHIPEKGTGTKYKIVCSLCGAADKVPFKPRTRNVLCRLCHRDKKGPAGSEEL